jgi:hypothetical protein
MTEVRHRKTGTPRGRRSFSAESRPKTTGGKYQKLKQNGDDMAKMGDDTSLGFNALMPVLQANLKSKRQHDIYANTLTMPNKQLKLMNIPVKSNLFFQKLLFYHMTYDVVYFTFQACACIYRMSVLAFPLNALNMISTICLFLWLPIEVTRMRYGYRGNI